MRNSVSVLSPTLQVRKRSARSNQKQLERIEEYLDDRPHAGREARHEVGAGGAVGRVAVALARLGIV